MPSQSSSGRSESQDSNSHHADHQQGRNASGRERLHLVGSPRLEVLDILAQAGLSPATDQQHLEIAPRLREIARKYEERTHENVRFYANLSPEVITGADMLRALTQQIGGDRLRHHPIINLAPLTVEILHQVTAVKQQLMKVYNDGSIVRWDAPQFSPHIHRAVFHELTNKLESNRAGFIGDERGGYLNQQFDRTIGELLQRGYNTVLILDDRCSRQTETLRHVRDRLARGRVGTLAFVVGHAAVPKFDSNGQPFRDDATGVRICAPVFRFNDPIEERSSPPGPADELKDLGYGSEAGHCYLNGYDLHIADTFRRCKLVLNQFIATHTGITEAVLLNLTGTLMAEGVRVVNSELLHQVLHKKSFPERTTINNRDLRELFSHDPKILEVDGRPDCNPNLASVARLPMLWPGQPTQNTFHTKLRGFDHNNPDLGWLKLSYFQLGATIDVVEQLEAVIREDIPASAFPFLSLSAVRNVLPLSAANPNSKARDVLLLLLRQLGQECGVPRVFHAP